MNFPRIACYSACRGGGAPLVKPDGSLDEPLITKLARYPTITLDASPWVSPYKPPRTDALMLLRKLNPSIRIGLYHVLGWFWIERLPAGFVSQHNTFADAFHDICREESAFMANGNVDVAKAEGRLTKLFTDAVSLGLFDFVFFDFMSAINNASIGAIERLTAAIKRAGGPDFKVLGNGWQSDAFDAEGSFREGFVATADWFNLVRQWRQARPHKHDDWIQAGTGYKNLDTLEAQRQARFVLGTACLFDCQASFGPDRDLTVQPYYGTWWLPEYDGGGIGTGWLGEPRGEAQGGSLWFRYFSGGLVVVNPNDSGRSATIPKGLCRFDGTEMGSVTVGAGDAVFLRRMQ